MKVDSFDMALLMMVVALELALALGFMWWASSSQACHSIGMKLTGEPAPLCYVLQDDGTIYYQEIPKN